MAVKGIGIDLVEIDHFRKKLSEDLIREVFLPDEIEYCRSQVRYWENFAGRFAAKEAVFKALGLGLSSGLRFRDIEVIRCPVKGSISVKLHGGALEAAGEMGITGLSVSISHTRRAAIALAVAETA